MLGEERRIGILGGTFDPPHVGHLVAAVNARHALGLDELLLVPANVPWQKVGQRRITDAAHRLAMVREAADGIDGVGVSTIELDRGGDSYTADTLAQLSGEGVALYLLIGSDIAPQLLTWRRPDEVRERCTLALYDRPGAVGGRAPEGWSWVTVPVPLLEVSSTDIRARVGSGRPIDGLVPPRVVRYIESHGLYRAAA